MQLQVLSFPNWLTPRAGKDKHVAGCPVQNFIDTFTVTTDIPLLTMLGNLVFPGNISLNMISICILPRGTAVDM